MISKWIIRISSLGLLETLNVADKRKDYLSYNNNKPATAANEPAPIPATPITLASPDEDFDEEAVEELEEPDLEAALALEPDLDSDEDEPDFEEAPEDFDEAPEEAEEAPDEAEEAPEEAEEAPDEPPRTADEALEAALSVPLEIAEETFEVALEAAPPLDESSA